MAKLLTAGKIQGFIINALMVVVVMVIVYRVPFLKSLVVR